MKKDYLTTVPLFYSEIVLKKSILLLLIVSALVTNKIYSQTNVDAWTTTTVPNVLDTRLATGGETLNFGAADSESITTITVGGVTLSPIVTPMTYTIRRVDNANTSGDDLDVWYRETNTPFVEANNNYTAPYLGTFSDILGANIIDVGSDNTFNNDVNPETSNVERIDVVFGAPVTMTAANLSTGFPIFERNNNGNVAVAAITGVDGSGNPTSYSNVVVNNGYGPALAVLYRYDLMSKSEAAASYTFSQSGATQALNGIFFSWSDFGLTPGQTVYGYSIGGADSPTTSAGFLNFAAFPTTTDQSNNQGGADLLLNFQYYAVAPVAHNDLFATNENIPVNGDLFVDNGNGVDVTGTGAITVTAFDAVSTGGGTVVVNPNGTFTYTPLGGYTGLDTFTYTITNESGLTDTATVRINVLLDTDGDGIANVGDPDDDNDGILDIDEICTPTGFGTFANGNGGAVHTFNYNTPIAEGYVDFDFIDNSLELRIGGTPIHPKILELELAQFNALTDVHIVFQSDGSELVTPWLANTNNLPRFRIVIDSVGNVLLYGSRDTNSVLLEPMMTEDGSLFPTVVFPAGPTTAEVENFDDGGLDAISGTIIMVCDSDGDGIANSVDLDSDNDGILDSVETNIDTDGDGLGDFMDTDSDYDGCFDAIEAAGAFTFADINANGNLTAAVDASGIPGGTSQATTANVTDSTVVDVLCDTDGDTIPIALDDDDDNDGIVDTDEACKSDAFANANGGGVHPFNYTDVKAAIIAFDFIDNSIQVDVDGNPVHSNILEFESAQFGVGDVQIVFLDGTEMVTPWLTNTNGLPRLRINIATDGTVQLWGTRNTGSVAFEIMRPNDGSVFNNITFPAGATTITVTNPDDGGADGISGTVYNLCDSDGDGIANFLDLDSDNDGIVDSVETNVDTDGDSLADFMDTDSDNDGCFDALEGAAGFTFADIDANGSLTGGVDTNGIPLSAGAGQATLPRVTDSRFVSLVCDTDGDTISPLVDLDNDNDGIPNTSEVCDPPFLFNGGVGGSINSQTFTNASIAVIDIDFLDNSVQVDIDGNPIHANILELEAAQFAVGDVQIVFQSDNSEMVTPWLVNTNGLPRFRITIDPFGIVRLFGTRDTNSTSLEPMITNDGSPMNVVNFPAGTTTITITNPDDNPGPDGISGTLTVFCDSDGDGVANALDLDSDNDGIVDVIEAGSTDADGNGQIDGFTDADNDGLDDTVAGTPLPIPNTDGTGGVDYLDIDADDDGIPDNIEGQPTAGYVAPVGTDTDGDGLDDSYDSDNGGTPIIPENTDGVDTPDYIDTDTDNDGVLDATENGVPVNVALGTDADLDGLDDAWDDVDGTGNTGAPANVNDNINPPNAANLGDEDGDGEVDYRDILDRDNDGVADNTDLDDDNDGILDTDENGGVDPFIDSDLDGIPNYLDPDSAGFVDANGDGVDDRFDFDGDGIIDQFDLDTDDDGIVDIIEAGGVDADGNGQVDGFTDANSDGLDDTLAGSPLPLPNTDTTGSADFRDIDADDDGIPDNIEAQPTASYIAPTDLDADGDGIDDAYDIDSGNAALVPENTDGTDNPDYQDTDTDNDGVLDATENGVPVNVALGTDADGDGLDDAWDDVDGSGGNIGTLANVTDNINPPNAANLGDEDGDGEVDYRDILDYDNDNVADNADLDDDNDGILDTDENNGVDPSIDTDLDGIPDYLDPDSAGFVDANTDGVDDRFDFDSDGVIDQFDLDSDNDGISDIVEAGGTDADGDAHVDYGTPGDPTTLNDANNNGLDDTLEGTPLPLPNTDANGKPDYVDIDADGDGIVDNIEGQTTANYIAPAGSDVDGDGLDDNYDGDDELTVGISGGAGPFGAVVPTNTDGADTPDYQDLNSDNDSDLDSLEGWDTNNDGTAETVPSNGDADGDGLDNAYDADDTQINPTNGQTPASFPDLDTPGGEPDWREALDIDNDNDGIDDPIDIDDDNDGIPDIVESTGNNPDGDEDGDGIVNWLDVVDNGNAGDGSITNYTDADGNGIPDVYDADADGIPNHLDLDSDNDGIYDFIESGQLDPVNNVVDTNNDGIIDAANAGTVGANGLLDTIETAPDSGVLTTPTADSTTVNGVLTPNGIPDSLETNSDGDGCADTIEAGFIDPDNNGQLGNGSFGAGLLVDVNGIVTGQGGYTTPDDNDGNGIFDFQEFGEAVSIAVQPTNQTVILNANANFDVTLGSGVNPTYEWFESTDNGVSFTSLVPDSGIYTGTNTATLTINANSLTLDGNQYYVVISAPGYACSGSVTSVPVTLTVQADFDGDGIGDPVDLDDDNDGIPDSIEGTGDLDGDGIPNHHDLDADGDGVYDTNEAGFADLDANNDGIIDGVNADFGANGLFDGVETAPDSGTINYVVLNTDGDANPNFLDIDDDNDGVNTVFENPSPDGDGDPADAQDTDGDGTPDYLDIDDDGDGVYTEFEVSNADGDGNPNTGVAIPNTDADLLPNYLDADDDGDGVDTIFENPNPDGDGNPNTGATQDTDNNGIPDYLDTDDDGDTILTQFEGANPDGDNNPNTGATLDSDNDGTFDYLDVDDDGDSVNTIFENPDPNGDGNPNDAQDTDGDGIADYLDVDDDGDGINTVDENPDPNGDGNPADAQDSDADGTPDYLDIDDDNDGIPTADEDLDGDGNPANDDTDNDGRPNYLDIDDDGDGIMTITETDSDQDSDGHPNYLDLDSDDDGIPDNVEGQLTAGYINPTGNDSDNDGLDDAYDNNSNNVPSNYETTNGIQPVNTDGTDTVDYLDLDSDNDTVPDSIEGHDFDANGEADVLPSGNDTDNDGLDDAYDGSVGDFSDPNGLAVVDNPANDLPNRDGDVASIYGGIAEDAEVDYRDTDDDGDGIDTINEDGDGDGDPTNDNCDEDPFPDYLDFTPCDLVPDGFSPNGDGVNDTLIIPALAQFPNFRMEVYDRWGNAVYEYDNNGRAQPLWWDGFSTGSRTINKGERVPVGTYFYVIEFNQDRREPISGWVYINY
jgi:gliding motility-associated-like protein